MPGDSILKVMDDVRARQGRTPINSSQIEGAPIPIDGPDFEPLPPPLEADPFHLPEDDEEAPEVPPLPAGLIPPTNLRATQEAHQARNQGPTTTEPDLVVVGATAAYKGRQAVLSEGSQMAIARIVLRESVRGAKAELDEVEKMVPKRARRAPEKKRRSKRVAEG